MEKKGLLKRIFKFITDVISWTCLCILILIGICIIWYVISSRIYAAKGEKYTPYFSLYTIISPSMEPNIKVYDVILDTRVDDPTTIKKGDVITFISSGSLSSGMTITHRVVEVIQTNEGLRFRTKGDNNQSPDGATVLPENILGKTLLRIPSLGRVQFLLAKKGGWFIIVLIPALGIIIYDLIKLFKVSGLKNKVDSALNSEPEENKVDNKNEQERKNELMKKLNVEIRPQIDNSNIIKNNENNIIDNYASKQDELTKDKDEELRRKISLELELDEDDVTDEESEREGRFKF